MGLVSPPSNILTWKNSNSLLLCGGLLCFLYYSHTFLLTLLIIRHAEEFPHTKQFSVTPAGCPTIKPHSNTVYLKIVADSVASGLNTPPSTPAAPKMVSILLRMLIASRRSQLPTTSAQYRATNQRVPRPSSQAPSAY